MSQPLAPATDPEIHYPEELPISARRDELIAAIRDHQVIVVAGETGSGKSTQLPKLCLSAGCGFVGHTQPRRIAARAVAERVAEELGSEIGGEVGFAVRFTDKVGPNTRIKLMTDGILLAEIQRDRNLSRYDAIILDEAHERSLNIDFLLGYLKRLLPRRPDLKVIVTSATIDTDRFSRHFDDAPVIEVSGRTHPVEIRHHPVEDREVPEAIGDAVRELWSETDGDCLVFLPGERDIREAAVALESLDLRDTEIFPLYARLSATEQHRVFTRHRGRRVVLATNIAETSITVPGITSVVDTGLARISRYSARTKVQRLPIEAISQASANQRAGRCGRIAPGICIRLFSEDDFEQRPEFTEPEIQRTNLASVILQMATLRLGPAEQFPFVDPPDHRSIRDGIALLEELDAVDPEAVGTRRWVTPVGRTLSRLPIDPRLGRMVVEAAGRGCVAEVSIIAAALSVQDPRERPSEKRQEASELHRRFDDPDSDFLTYLHLWDHLRRERSARSSSQFRKMCRREFLNWNRIREWQDVEQQIRRVGRPNGLRPSGNPGEPDQIHRSLLAGLLSQIGRRDERSGDYVGPRSTRFAIAPGSVHSKRGPSWIMAAELVETHRLQARVITRIDPAWVEELASHLVDRTYRNPRWIRERGGAVADERVLLHGLPLVVDRRVPLGRVNPELARDMFIHHALIDGDWDDHYPFRDANDLAIAEVQELEARARRRDLLVENARLHAFFDERLGAEVVSARHFRTWYKKHGDERLRLSPADLLTTSDVVDEELHPPAWVHEGHRLPLSYEFDPSSPIDGVTVDVPLALLPELSMAPFEWNVPGLRRELVESLMRRLPKATRRELVPIPASVDAVMPHLDRIDGELSVAFRHHVGRRIGAIIPDRAVDLADVPPHLRMTFRVVDEDGTMIVAGKNLDRLRERLRETARASLRESTHTLEQRGLVGFPEDGVPPTVETTEAGFPVTMYPALADRGEHVDLVLLHDVATQQRTMWQGTRRLLRLTVPLPTRSLTAQVRNELALALTTSPYGTAQAWIEDVLTSAVDHLLATAGGPANDPVRFRALQTWVAAKGPELIADLGARSETLVLRSQRMRSQPMTPDMEAHLDRLTGPNMLADAGVDHLDQLDNALHALELRQSRQAESPGRDADAFGRIVELDLAMAEALHAHPRHARARELFWMREELRVQTFAQERSGRGRVSEKKIRACLRDILAP